jgi:putative tryptophan/tyrosine transport system substrate-binding protein
VAGSWELGLKRILEALDRLPVTDLELVPQAAVVALLVNPNNPIAERVMRNVQEAARAKGVQLQILKAGTEGEINAAFETLVEPQAGALVVSADPFFGARREQLVASAAHYAVPTIYFRREFAKLGGLISYASSLTAAFRQVGGYAGKILQVPNPPICRSNSQPHSSWSSISRPPRRSA